MKKNSTNKGFFLMEVVVLMVFFISFSMAIVGWYSNFVIKKMDMMNRGKALFIASHVLELIKAQGEHAVLPNLPGFTIKTVINKEQEFGDFARVAVSVSFSKRLPPILLSTGMLMKG